MLYGRNVSKELWTEAVNHANYIRNRVLSSTATKISYQLYHNKVQDVSKLKVVTLFLLPNSVCTTFFTNSVLLQFDSRVFYHIPDEQRRKLDAKARKACETSKGYPIWSLVERKMCISRDVIFDESGNDDQAE